MFKELIECKKNGLVKNIGVSIYTNTQFEDCISNKEIDIIQSPFNVLDNENLRGQLLQSALNENKIVHTRSAFLQGLFYIKNNFPKKLEPLKKYIQKVTRIAEKNNYSVAELALNYCLTQKNIQNVLIGVDSKQQLLENIETAKKGISINVVNEIKDIQVKEIELLNPANWN